jgi:CRISPR-associated endonuclease/helicase Cas3
VARLKTKRGHPVTDELVEKLATEAEAGYDLSKAVPERTRGRPPLGDKAEGVSPRITYRVPSDLYQAAQRKAKAEGRSVSEIAREALEHHLAE